MTSETSTTRSSFAPASTPSRKSSKCTIFMSDCQLPAAIYVDLHAGKEVRPRRQEDTDLGHVFRDPHPLERHGLRTALRRRLRIVARPPLVPARIHNLSGH